MIRWVVDTSPLVFLAKLDRLELLRKGVDEVLLLAERVGAERVVLDDLNARHEARRRGLKPIGTLGILLAARLRWEIPSLCHEIERLHKHGFRANPALVEAVLRQVGEYAS